MDLRSCLRGLIAYVDKDRRSRSPENSETPMELERVANKAKPGPNSPES